MGRLVQAYTEELIKLLADEMYKKLTPAQQINAQSELTHWYQRLFNQIPSPEVVSVDSDEYVDITETDIPHALQTVRDGISKFYGDYIPLSLEQLREKDPFFTEMPKKDPGPAPM